MKLYNKNINTCYFLGIGGKGMYVLAQYLNNVGIKVSGYDQYESDFTRILEQQNIRVSYEEDVTKLKNLNPDLVIYTPALNVDTNQELKHCFSSKLLLKKRSEVLGEISKIHKSICIAGTHGKTSISGLLAHIFNNENSEIKATSLVGGVIGNYSNGFLSNESDFLILESDEYDKSFLNFHPFALLISNIESDHMDTYGSLANLFEAFKEISRRVPKNGFISVCYDRPEINEVTKMFTDTRIVNYSYSSIQSNVYAKNIRFEDYKFVIDVYVNNTIFISDLKFQSFSHKQVENLLGAISIAVNCGIKPDIIKRQVATYKGVSQRNEICFKSNEILYISDYAHHPTEVSTTITSIKELLPHKKILLFFHPHLFSRTKAHFEDFASSLDMANSIYILPIYPAREEPIPGVSSKLIFDRMSSTDKHLIQKNEILNIVSARWKEYDIIITMGAGSITMLKDSIVKILHSEMS